jgi:hypothetical protein
LKDTKFRSNLPSELDEDVRKYELNPGCPCNLNIYRNVLKYASKELREYYPDREVMNPDAELIPLQKNDWKVINCHISEAERKIQEYTFGRYQIALARYEDQVTILINGLDDIVS